MVDLLFQARVVASSFSKEEDKVEGGWTVQFVDFGNCEEVTEVRELPSTLRVLPTQAVRFKIRCTVGHV